LVDAQLMSNRAVAPQGVAAFLHSDTQLDALFAAFAPANQWELSSQCMIDQPT
jgi:hypothetical protein